jgi:prepilin-type N-terminal cleavage/methylation domain-containing protein
MRSEKSRRRNSKGFTLIEMAMVVAVLAVMASIAVTYYDTFMAHVRWSSVKANMDSIGKAAFMDYANNLAWPPLTFGAMPPSPSNMAQLLPQWPQPPCPGWYYSWEDWEPAYATSWVTLRKSDNSAYYAYCVGTNGGSATACGVDPFNPTAPPPIEIASNESMDRHIFCDQ